MITMLNVLLPRMLPTARSYDPLSTAVIVVATSGSDVAAAIRVLPTKVDPSRVAWASASPVRLKLMPAKTVAAAAAAKPI